MFKVFGSGGNVAFFDVLPRSGSNPSLEACVSAYMFFSRVLCRALSRFVHIC